MSKARFFHLTKLIKRRLDSARIGSFSTYRYLLNRNTEDLHQNTEAVHQNINLKHNIMNDDDNEVVLDIYKERLKYSPLLEEEETEDDRYAGLNLNRGVYGVFDIEDLVHTLQSQNALDIFVASVPKDIKYVDYIVVVSGRSQRHMQAIAQFVRRVYKHKRDSSDIIPKLEGETSQDWMALDLGNIALHIFSKKARAIYDLDTLWAVGPKYDEECNKKEPISNILEKHSLYLEGLEPAS